MDSASLEILGPALLAGALVLLTHVPLGREVLSRGIIFIDLAIAQVAALGVIIAYSLGWGHEGWEIQLSALLAALLAAAFMRRIERHWPYMQEALIGTVFVVAASLGIVLLSGNPHGSEHLKELLAGQILWVSYAQLLPIAVLYVALLVTWFVLPRWRQKIFFVIFALAVTTSVQLVGVYLVFASLIVPALTVSRRPANVVNLMVAYGVGLAGYIAGLLCSLLWDFPAGPVIVCTLVLSAITFALVRRLFGRQATID